MIHVAFISCRELCRQPFSRTPFINTPHKKLFIHTYYYWNNKHGNVKENISCASFRIHLLSLLRGIGSKVFVKYLWWYQKYFRMDYPSPFSDLPLPQLCLVRPFIVKFLPLPPLLTILNFPYLPICNFGGQGVQTMCYSWDFCRSSFSSVYLGYWVINHRPLKNTTPSFLPSPFLGNLLIYIGFSWFFQKIGFFSEPQIY